ncbi:MAG: hypothetical protein EBX52_06275, partial [Proteobacteria bacterium]|nr:hypothetical protein [Pseudomonadota bacterium]
MRVFVSAAEISSDIHAEKILRALIAQLPGVPLEICGIGGPALRSVPGFRCLQDAESMRTMGFVEVLGKIPSLLSIQSKIITCLDEYPPDLILTFDYPDFHFSLLQKLSKKSWFGNSLRICGIPPKVWVWRKHRVEAIRRLYDGVWVIFPFERDFYENLGIPVIYEGNPLISDLVLKSAGAGDPEAAQDMKERILRLAALPGSREAEIRGHLPILSRTLEQLSVLTGRPVVAEIPVPKGLDPARIESQLPSTERVRYRFSAGDSGAVLARNPIGLIKSGTSTLEAAVLGCVPVIFYRMSPVSEWIFRTLVRYRGPVGLPNILLGIRDRSQAVFPEFLGGEANPDSLAREIELLLANPEILENRKRAGASLRDQLVSKGDVASRVAQEILKWRESVASAGILRRRATWISLVSAL